ncbi:MAG: MBOAT family O-acyltransferase [Archangium sp.]|nr:MBOAT family O-acyltransferase [Archangium sp.]MDP3571965.1 MBOAT family O-acyltransferase [Archangium sp.]
MLFNSHLFLFGFLPLALLAVFSSGRSGLRGALAALTVLSIGFYAWWDWHNLFLLIPSLLVNFAFGRALTRDAQRRKGPASRALLAVAIAFNLLLLGYFKYTDFALSTVSTLTGVPYALRHIVLPLGISFFTFEQIAYVVDSSKGHVRPYGFLEYCVFVTFFPHLIAGPIIQHDELLAQMDARICTPRADNLALGFSLLAIGLFKKVALADSVAGHVGGVYDVSASAPVPTLAAAWLATVAYSVQLYFDFSGYSDMAIGLARMFNLKLPANFDSPYRAHNIIEFWRRWHMTLSRFLRNYLYIPLGGNRGGPFRRYLNLFITMVLGGLWHGAGWGFVLWGGLNGLYLVVNHLWRGAWGLPKDNAPPKQRWRLEVGLTTTFVLIMASRVFFRSNSLAGAGRVFAGLVGQGGLGLSVLRAEWASIGFLLVLYGWCRWAPNSQQWLAAKDPLLAPVEGAPKWQVAFTPRWALGLAALTATSLLLLNRVSEFLYFQF